MSGYIGCEGAGCGVGDRCSRLGAGVARKAPGNGLCGVCTERDIVCVWELVQDPGQDGSQMQGLSIHAAMSSRI